MRKFTSPLSFTFLTSIFLLIGLNASAQSGTIRGTVRDPAGNPLNAASVMLEGRRSGTVTNAAGSYSLTVSAGDYTIIVSFVGHVTQRANVSVADGATVTQDFTLAGTSDLSGVLVIGSRSRTVRSSTTTPAPVDVITARELIVTGQVEPTQMINFIAPSFNSSRQTIADGTDHIDPATLRGLGPDQVLVLVNGKRRHNTALINVNGTIGRGSVGTDLNSIPASSIERIEVLRDGASSQYGSDAIAGVVNVVLKKNIGITNINTHAGQQYLGDGEVGSVGLDHGFKLGSAGGFLNVAGDFRYRGATNRAGDYTGPVYVNNNPAQDEAMIQQRGFSRKKNMLIGNSQLVNTGFMANMELPLTEAVAFFANGGYNFRKGKAAGFYRYPFQTSQVIPELYPNGFLPEIHSTITDKSFSYGFRGALADWQWDISSTYGGNSFRFDIENTNNASQFALGLNAPTEFYAGTLIFNQITNNLNISKDFGAAIGLPSFNVAGGLEYRIDNYQIKEGEEGSWRNYDPQSGKVGGAQVFPGFQPSNAVNQNRNVFGVYADIESDLSNKLLVNVAGRYEDYSDFGNNVAGKLAIRYKLTNWLNLRGSVSNGFRAPSIHQRYFSAISTVFVNTTAGLVPLQQGTFRNNSDIAAAFGIPSLKAETSKNFSVGLTSNFSRNWNLTADAYFITIDNRIVVTGSFTKSNPTVAQILANYPDITSAIFFTNAINTETRGLDVVLAGNLPLGKGGLDITLAGNINKTSVVGNIQTTSKLPNDSLNTNTLFNIEERGRIERGQPRNKLALSLNYRVGKFGLVIRNTRFGEVATIFNGTDRTRDEYFSPKVVTDASISFRPFAALNIIAGANNIFDVYPDPQKNPANVSLGRFVYSRGATQFGFNGGYYYVGLNFSFQNN
jgi:iron complex outermembrane receptor protein